MVECPLVEILCYISETNLSLCFSKKMKAWSHCRQSQWQLLGPHHFVGPSTNALKDSGLVKVYNFSHY